VKVHVITRDIRNEQNVDFYASYDVIIATVPDFNVLSSLDAGSRLAKRPFYAGGVHGLYGFIFADLGSHDYVIEREKSNMETRLGPESSTRSVIHTTTKKENGKIIEMVTKREVYTPLLLANTAPLPNEIRNSPRNLRRVHPLLTCLRALWEYQRKGQGLYPSHDHADLQAFTLLATEKHKELQLPADTLRSEFLRSFLQNLGSEFAPVSACIGGFLAQDVINVLGQREQPIQNLSLFDGDSLEGPIYSLHPIFSDCLNPAPVAAPPAAAVELD
jgi:ubiquitin-like 1-activating enzyme E1 A